MVIFFLADNVGLAYPFFYRPMFEIMEDGWHAFHPETEFSRLIGRSEEWRLCHVNKNFEVSCWYNSTNPCVCLCEIIGMGSFSFLQYNMISLFP